MEQTILLKGIALLSALTSIQQWTMHEITPFDLMFLILVVAFLITLERDYLSYIGKQRGESNSSVPILDRGLNFPIFEQISIFFKNQVNYSNAIDLY